MKKLILFLGLFALLLYGCQSPSDSSSVLENSSIEEASSEEISSEDVSSEEFSSEDVSSEETSSEAAPVEIPEDEPYVQLTALSEDEIADLNLPEGYYSAEFKDGFFTKELIAVSFAKNAAKGSGDIHVVISRDGGVTWEEQIVDERHLNDNFITFSSEKNGCLVVQGEYGVARQGDCYIFVTHDGGKSWQEVTSVNTVSRWRISDALFISRNVGFVCHVYNAESHPVFCRTTDGGMSWEKVVLETEEMKNRKASYGHICKAEYKNGIVEFTVEFQDNEADRIYYSKYVSKDMGQTFEKAE